MTKQVLICFLIAFLSLTAKATLPNLETDPIAVLPQPGLVPDGVLIPGDGTYFSEYTFVADKSRRTLTVWKSENNQLKMVKALPIDMGKKPGDKLVSGDLKTPEGIYFFQKELRDDQLNFQEYGQMAFTMNYPNFYDRRDKKTGHGIWLHAIPDSKSLHRGSRGCLVVRNNVITELKKYVTLEKTPILVFNEVHYITPDEAKKKRQTIVDKIKNWKASWTGKNIEQYMQYYSSNFKSLSMDKERWYHYKKNLNKKYSFIKVQIDKLVAFKNKDHLMVQFLQRYESDTNQDFGQKTLFFKQNPEQPKAQYKIIGETWEAVKKELFANIQKND